MDRAIEIDVLRRLLALHAQQATSLADAPRRQRTAVYCDVERLAAEQASLLKRGAHIVGLACELPAPGAWFTTQVGDLPLLLVRDADGQARAFLNACRHRGSAVASGRGADSRGFVCRYHGWSYDLGGNLRGRPGPRAAFDGLTDCTSLVALPCVDDCGLLVVGLESHCALDVQRMLAGLGDELASLALADYRLVGERNTAWAFNWKLGIETFMEAYHIASLHRDTLARQLNSAPMLSEFFGPHGRGVVMGKDCPALSKRPEHEWTRFHNATWVYWLFPNVVLSLPQSGHVELWTFTPVAGRPAECNIGVRFYAAPTAPRDDAFWQRLIEFTMSVVDAEDFGQQLLIQRNVVSGLLPHVVFGRNEPALSHFHQQLDAVLGASGA